MKQAVTVARPPAKPLMIYDGECNFCKFWIMRLREFTGDRIEFTASQDPRVAADFPELPREWFDQAVQFIEPDGSVYAGAEAGFRALGCRAAGKILKSGYETVPVFAAISDSAYYFIAKRREFFSKLTRLLWGRDGAVPRYDRVRWVFLRMLGIIYLIAFASLGTQIKGLIGATGIDPAAELMTAARQHFDAAHIGLERYHRLPTLCWFNASDRFLKGLCVTGGVFAVALVLNFAPASCLVLLWLIYLSLMSVGGDFLSFQWDALLLETGFFAIFFAPPQLLAWRPMARPSRAALWLLRWLLFQLIFESGAVKLLGGDSTWRHLLALNYHYETQPLPTWIGWYAHQLPEAFQKASVLVMFVIELAVPFLLFAPRRLRIIGSFLLIFLQAMILLTGNYCFFNLLTIALCLLWLDDASLMRFIPSLWRKHGTVRDPIAIAVELSKNVGNEPLLPRPVRHERGEISPKVSRIESLNQREAQGARVSSLSPSEGERGTFARPVHGHGWGEGKSLRILCVRGLKVLIGSSSPWPSPPSIPQEEREKGPSRLRMDRPNSTVVDPIARDSSVPESKDGTMPDISIPPITVDSPPRPRGWPHWLVRPVSAFILLVTFSGMIERFGWLPATPLSALSGWLGPFQTLNHYGLFMVMTTQRPEIIIEGSNDGKIWLPYEFKYKAGDVNRRLVFVAPHQPRLDWQMWFAALRPKGRDRWFIGLCIRLLEGSPDVLALIERNPFPGKPPRYLRAEYYDYHFTNFAERRSTGAWWRRKLIGEYLPPVPLPGK